MSKLFILGNGFDLASGLPTRYSDLKKWFKNNHDLNYDKYDKIVNEETFFELTIPSKSIGRHGEEEYGEEDLAPFFYVLIAYANSEDNTWNSFERNLSKLPYDGFDDNNYYDGDDLIKEAEYAEDIGSELAEAFVYSINKYFSEWVNSIHLSQNLQKKKLIVQNTGSTFLTFNYTSVLEDIYKIPETQICHIHGYVKDENNQLVIGYRDNVSENDYDDDYDPLRIGYYLNEAKEELKKPVKKIILKYSTFFQNLGILDEIYIIGWDMKNPDFVDAPYLHEIVTKHTTKKTVIYFNSFNEIDKDLFKTTCTMNGFKGKFGICNLDTANTYLI